MSYVMEEVTSISTLKRPAGTCAYWLQKRKRFCRTKPLDDQDFCESHLTKASTEISCDSVNDCKNSIIESVNDNTECQDELSTSIVTHAKSAETISGVLGRPDALPDRCHFWIQKKMRYCKARVSREQPYCVEHSINTGSESSRVRMSCPIDPKHSCYADQLERHLKRCNARNELRPVYFSEGINSGELNNESPEDLQIRVHDIDVAELNSIIDIVKTLHLENVKIKDSMLSHAVVQQEIDKPTNGTVAQKHLYQQSSLIGNLESLGLLKDHCNYIEFGAGKGGLSHWVQLANKSNVNTKYLLVERSSVRYKKDSFHRGENQGPNFERLKIDIENLDLCKVDSLSSNTWPLVGTGKHLCGAATDMMLRCLCNGVSDQATDKHCGVDGLLVALCCHHRCNWKTFVGKDWFVERGLGPRQFSLITSMSAWATCGMKHVAATKDELHTIKVDVQNLKEEIADKDKNTISYNHPRYGSLLPEEREDIGFKCKRLIDRGRMHYLMTHGYDVNLIYYVESALTLENTALVAVLNKSTH